VRSSRVCDKEGCGTNAPFRDPPKVLTAPPGTSLMGAASIPGFPTVTLGHILSHPLSRVQGCVRRLLVRKAVFDAPGSLWKNRISRGRKMYKFQEPPACMTGWRLESVSRRCVRCSGTLLHRKVPA
jgi:hypothetical protein